MREAAFRRDDEVRERHWLAELQPACRRRSGIPGRPQLWGEPDRSALCALRLPSRACFSRWSCTDVSALLHQWRRAEFQARLEPLFRSVVAIAPANVSP